MNKYNDIHEIWKLIHNSCGEKISSQITDVMLENLKRGLTLTDAQNNMIWDIKANKTLLRKHMDKYEIRNANKLVELGYLRKGISDDKQKTVIYMSNI